MKKNNSLFILLCFLSFILLVLTYSNHFQNAFQFDDGHTIVNNVYIRDIGNIPLFFRDARAHGAQPQNQTYRPLTSATFAIDYWLGEGLHSTFYFHLSTFIWYVVQCILMYFLYLKIINAARLHEWNRYFALFAVSWYGLHTANAETINYIYQRADSLSTLMVVAGFVLYAYLPKWRTRYLYLIPVVFGMFIKEPTAMFAPMLFFYIMLVEKKYSLQDSFRSKNIFIGIRESLPAFIICIALSIFIKSMMSGTYIPGGTSRFHYLITQPFVILRYGIAFFLPFGLSADTDWKLITNIFDIRLIVGILFIFVMLYSAYIASKKQETRPIAFGILWFFLALLPTSSVIPLAEVTNDHRMFFPFVGLTLSVSWTLGLIVLKNKHLIRKSSLVSALIIVLAMGILGGHAYGTHQRNKVWHTGESLWYDVTKKSPGNGRGLMNYGLTQMAKGNYPEAEEYFEKALVLTPYYSTLHVNVAILKGAMNQPVEAEKYFKNALQYGPNDPESYFFYARWLKSRNRNAEAVVLLQRALQLAPAHVDAQILLDEILARNETAISPVKKAEETAVSNPTPENYLNLSLLYHKAGRFSDSITACQKALTIKPDYYLAYNNICAAYNELTMWDKAIEACEKGLGINSSFELLKNNLARAKRERAFQRSK
jgi:protein O-mannosyl-transferase